MSLPPPPPVPRGRRPLTAAELEASSTDESSSEEKREEREREEKREEQKKREEQRPPPLPPKPAARVHEARQAQAARRSDADTVASILKQIGGAGINGDSIPYVPEPFYDARCAPGLWLLL